jgi:hypothetical protein
MDHARRHWQADDQRQRKKPLDEVESKDGASLIGHRLISETDESISSTQSRITLFVIQYEFQ